MGLLLPPFHFRKLCCSAVETTLTGSALICNILCGSATVILCDLVCVNCKLNKGTCGVFFIVIRRQKVVTIFIFI